MFLFYLSWIAQFSVLENDDYKCQESKGNICAGQDVIGFFKSVSFIHNIASCVFVQTETV